MIPRLLLFMLGLSLRLHGQVIEAEIAVFGATSAGVAAAVQAGRLGHSVVLIGAGSHLGGMTSGGLGQTDIGNKAAIGGLAREFYQRVGRHYLRPEMWVFEPHVATDVFYEMLNEARVVLYLGQELETVQKDGARLTEMRFASGKIVRARVFIDASYEGNLLALAGVSFTIGREANAQYAETLNGIRGVTLKHQFTIPVEGFKGGNLLPLVQPVALGEPGAADHSVQAYNFRLTLTQNPANRREIDPPSNYDPAKYELLAQWIEALEKAGRPPALGELMHIQIMPNGKTDINNNGPISTDHIGFNHDYPGANAARRSEIWRDHEDYTRGFLHLLATSPRVPSRLRAEMQSWGLTRDEFLETRGWPPQLYVREARRMISDYVMTERNCVHSLSLNDAVGLAAYQMDSHNCRRLIRDGRVENEGDVQTAAFPPYPIAYRSLVPKQAECDNLIVPVCLSASHIAYGSIRMEPVFMVLGHSSATAAHLAIRHRVPVQTVPMRELQDLLRRQRQILIWKP